MLLKALLIGSVAGLSQLDGSLFGECKIREPLVTGLLVGIILGDVSNGCRIGAELQLAWMGVTGIGLTSGLAIGPGGTLGVAYALMTNASIETAIAFGVPVSVLLSSVGDLKCTSFAALAHKADEYAKVGDTKGMTRMHFIGGFFNFFLYFFPVFLAVYFGSGAVQKIVDSIPAWASRGLTGVAQLMPCLGFGMLLQILIEPRLVPYFMIGFAAAAYLGLNMMCLTIVGIAVAIIAFNLRSKIAENTVQEDDEL